MTNYNVFLFESDNTEAVDRMVNDFLKNNNAKLMNVSHSSTFNPKTEKVIFSIAIAIQTD